MNIDMPTFSTKLKVHETRVRSRPNEGLGPKTHWKLRFKALPGGSPGTHLVAFDVTLDGRRYGQRFDAIINVAGNAGTSRPRNRRTKPIRHDLAPLPIQATADRGSTHPHNQLSVDLAARAATSC